MSQESDEQQPMEELLGADGPTFEIPKWLRVSAVIVLSIILFAALALFITAVFGFGKVDPSKLGLSNLIIFSVLGLFVFLIPWHDYGLRLKKFGPFEFEQILITQAKEHATELRELRERILKLERVEKTTESMNVSGDSDQYHPGNKELIDLLLKFLNKNSTWAFSPSRIISWGGKQPGFEPLGGFSSPTIRKHLQLMVADGYAETRISKKGNTLYRTAL